MWFLLFYSNFISLRRYHFLPVISIALATLRAMFSLVGGGELGKEVLLLMLSYFGNLVVFCLILNFFKVFILLSMVIKEKFSK